MTPVQRKGSPIRNVKLSDTNICNGVLCYGRLWRFQQILNTSEAPCHWNLQCLFYVKRETYVELHKCFMCLKLCLLFYLVVYVCIMFSLLLYQKRSTGLLLMGINLLFELRISLAENSTMGKQWKNVLIFGGDDAFRWKKWKKERWKERGCVPKKGCYFLYLAEHVPMKWKRKPLRTPWSDT